jgi:hypothetical protein
MNIYGFWLSWLFTVAITLGIIGIIKVLGYPLGHGYGRQETGALDKLIREAEPEKEILVITDGFYEELWGKPEFKKWIEDAKKRGAEIRVITGPSDEGNVEKLIESWVKNGIIELRKSDEPEALHFIIVDGKRGYIEEDPTSSFYVKSFYRRARNNLLKRFNEIWDLAEGINKKNIL